MSNARDKANIPALNFSSTGIDDNATSTAITIDSNETSTLQCSAGDNNFALLAYHPTSTATRTIAKFQSNVGGTQQDKVVIQTSGDVGIGTSSPTTKLDVEGTGVPVEINSSNSNTYKIQFADNGTVRGYIGSSSATPIRFANSSASELMRINSSGNVGIGTSSPANKLHVLNASSGATYTADGADLFIIENNDSLRIDLKTTSANTAGIMFSDNVRNAGALQYSHSNDSMLFRVNSSTRFNIGNTLLSSNSGNITSFSRQNAGFTYDYSDAFTITRSSGQPLEINRTTNDGNLIAFYQDDSQEGAISVSGSTVSYGGFTGTHWSRFTDNSTPTILKGTVLETLDEMCDWYNLEFDVTTQDEDGNDITSPQKIPHVLLDGQSDGDVITYNHEGTDYQATIVKEGDIKHMKSKVSDTVDAKNVYGVFVAYDEDGEGYNDFYVASVGSYVVRIKANETIVKGDLLQSNGDGTAKVQIDDAVRSSSFAKVLSTTIIETYEDGSYLVPCSLMC